MDSAAPDPGNQKAYTLKSMVLARILAEASVLLVLILLPPILQFSGHLTPLPVPSRAVLFLLSALAIMILPVFGFVVYRVKVDDAGLTTLALLKKQSCQWRQIKGLRRRSTWNWLRYVVELEEGELSFPVLISGCDELVSRVRRHLPSGAAGGADRDPFRLRQFQVDPVALLYQLVQALGGIFFIGICWLFLIAIGRSGNAQPVDLAMVLCFCLGLTVILLWRTYVVALMPKSVAVSKDELVVKTLFGERKFSWLEVLSVGTPIPLLPEGFMLKTKKYSYLIGTGMDAADELQEALQAGIQAQQKSQLS